MYPLAIDNIRYTDLLDGVDVHDESPESVTEFGEHLSDACSRTRIQFDDVDEPVATVRIEQDGLHDVGTEAAAAALPSRGGLKRRAFALSAR